MEYRVGEITDDQVTQFFMDNPLVTYMGLSDDTLAEILEVGKYIPHKGSVYNGVYDADGHLVSVLKYEHFTKACINVHFYLESAKIRRGYAYPVGKAICTYLRDEIGALKIVCMTPSCCEHVVQTALKIGLILEGRLTKAVFWRQELVDLLIFAINLEELE